MGVAGSRANRGGTNDGVNAVSREAAVISAPKAVVGSGVDGHAGGSMKLKALSAATGRKRPVDERR
jgi:hypothetical protein